MFYYPSKDDAIEVYFISLYLLFFDSLSCTLGDYRI